MRHALAAIAIVAATTAGAAAQQAASPPDGGGFNAAAYIRGLIENDRYDPRDRERAINGGHVAADPHWRSSIFDGRRTRATRSTGLRLPDLPRPDGE